MSSPSRQMARVGANEGANESKGARGFHRREFLLASALFTASPWLPQAFAQSSRREGLAKALPLTVGYFEASETLRSMKQLPRIVRQPVNREAKGERSPRIVPAASLPIGDSELLYHPLSVTVLGLYPPAALTPKQIKQLPRAIDLEIWFPPLDVRRPEPLLFNAWSLRRQPTWSPSPPVHFTFPIDPTSPFELALSTVDELGVRQTSVAQFAIDPIAGAPRLRRGLYLLPLRHDAWGTSALLSELVQPAAAIERASILVSIESGPDEVSE